MDRTDQAVHRRRPRVRLGLALGITAALLLGSLGAKAGGASQPTVLHLHFTLAGMGNDLVTDGRYAFVGSGTTGAGTIHDERTGAHWTVSPPCRSQDGGPPVFGGPWLLTGCAGKGALYSLSSRRWRIVTPDPSFSCITISPHSDCQLTAVQVGADWIEFEATYNCEINASCQFATMYQRVDTGQLAPRDALRGWRAGGTVIPDLDSPSLTRKLCSPLRVPASVDAHRQRRPGTVAFDGAFAIAESTTSTSDIRAALERCGSRLDDKLGSIDQYTASAGLVVWQGVDQTSSLDGLYLPSLRRFRAQLPAGVSPGVIGLSGRTIFVLDLDTRKLWTATVPPGVVRK